MAELFPEGEFFNANIAIVSDIHITPNKIIRVHYPFVLNTRQEDGQL